MKSAVMVSLPASFARAFGQLGDPAILRVLGKTLAITLAVFAVLGLALWYALSSAIEGWGYSLGSEIGALVAVLLTALGGWLLFRLVALFVLQFFAGEVVEAVEARFYPEKAAQVRAIPIREEMQHAARGALRALAVNAIALPFALVLLVTGVGTAILFWAVNGWLLGRELQDMVWLRHRRSPDEKPPVGALQRFLLGGATAGLMFVPFLNLLAPVIGAASATHLVHRRREAASA
ncbi:EI24 domain-containing protein [Qipengyuania oceanensis]|nr:EI24 domain-containing protein [Qipengyuania oceanensis]